MNESIESLKLELKKANAKIEHLNKSISLLLLDKEAYKLSIELCSKLNDEIRTLKEVRSLPLIYNVRKAGRKRTIDYEALHDLKSKGFKIREIALTLGVSESTVKHVLSLRKSKN